MNFALLSDAWLYHAGIGGTRIADGYCLIVPNSIWNSDPRWRARRFRTGKSHGPRS